MKLCKLLSLFTVFFVSLLVTVSCTPSPQTSTSLTSLTTTPIRIGFNNWPCCIPLQVAQVEKLFNDNRINVDLRWFESYSDSIKALASGSLDGGEQTLNDTISAVANGSDKVTVLVIDNSTGSDAVIVRKGINSIADLKGKKVATEEGAVDHFLLIEGLKKAGMTQADIQLTPLNIEEATKAYLAGNVDAVSLYDPFTTKVLLRPGSKVLFSSKDFPGTISDHLAVNRKLVNEKPQEVQALVNSWFDTLNFIRKHPEKSYEIMAARAGVSVEEYKSYDTGLKIFNVEDNLKAFSSGNDMTSLAYAAKEINKFLFENKLIKKEPDLSKIFDDRFVKAYAADHRS